MKRSFTIFVFYQVQISTYKFNQSMINTYLVIVDNCPIHRFNGEVRVSNLFTADGSRLHFFTPIQPQGLAVIFPHRQVYVKREGRTLFAAQSESRISAPFFASKTV